MKYNDNGEYKDIYVKAFDTLPIGTEVDYDGNTVPTGWTEITNPNVYSTTETDTGKIWVDDKKIYRKVVKITSLVSGGRYNHGINNINEIISVSGMAYFTGTGAGWQLVPRVVGNSNFNLGLGDISSTQFLWEVGSSYTGFSKAYFIFEYTKTS